MASPAVSSCSVEGAKHFSPTAAESEICDAFQRDFYAAMDDEGASGIFSIALTVSPERSISAQITQDGAASGRTFPQVAVDVMDRNLDYRDLTQLAGAAAKVVKTEQTRD